LVAVKKIDKFRVGNKVYVAFEILPMSSRSDEQLQASANFKFASEKICKDVYGYAIIEDEKGRRYEVPANAACMSIAMEKLFGRKNKQRKRRVIAVFPSLNL
jgi:hypothetical protein